MHILSSISRGALRLSSWTALSTSPVPENLPSAVSFALPCILQGCSRQSHVQRQCAAQSCISLIGCPSLTIDRLLQPAGVTMHMPSNSCSATLRLSFCTSHRNSKPGSKANFCSSSSSSSSMEEQAGQIQTYIGPLVCLRLGIRLCICPAAQVKHLK